MGRHEIVQVICDFWSCSYSCVFAHTAGVRHHHPVYRVAMGADRQRVAGILSPHLTSAA